MAPFHSVLAETSTFCGPRSSWGIHCLPETFLVAARQTNTDRQTERYSCRFLFFKSIFIYLFLFQREQHVRRSASHYTEDLWNDNSPEVLENFDSRRVSNDGIRLH